MTFVYIAIRGGSKTFGVKYCSALSRWKFNASSVNAALSLESNNTTISFLAVSAGLGYRAYCSAMPGIDVGGLV